MLKHQIVMKTFKIKLINIVKLLENKELGEKLQIRVLN